MEHIEAHDVIRLKEILRRTGEFIAYFELAETKMVEWRQGLEQQALTQQKQFQQQLHSLRTELDSLQEILTQAGLTRFRTAVAKALDQSKEHLYAMQKAEQRMVQQWSSHQQELNQFTEMAVLKITQHAAQALERIDIQLAQYDVQHFYRIANDSTEQVEKSANNAIATSEKLLRLFHWRAVSLAFLTTMLTAFAISLYMSDEYPWEIHQHALNERGAGKMLMSAWPTLSHQEKTKILGHQANPKV